MAGIGVLKRGRSETKRSRVRQLDCCTSTVLTRRSVTPIEENNKSASHLAKAPESDRISVQKRVIWRESLVSTHGRR